MAYTQAELSGPINFGDDKKVFFYDGNDASDNIKTINTAGYFNNTDDVIRMAVEDLIFVRASDGFAVLQVTAVSSGSVTTHLVSGNDVPVESITTATVPSAYGFSYLTAAATGNEKVYLLPAPTRAGQRKTFMASVATDFSIQSTGGWAFAPSGNASYTMIGNATRGTALELVALSTTAWAVIGGMLLSTGEVTTT